MRKILLIFSAAIVLVSTAALFFVIPHELKIRIPAAIEQVCGGCSFKIRKASVSLLPPSVTFRDLSFVAGNPQSTAFDVKVDRITARLSLLALLNHMIQIKLLQIEAPYVVITEGDLRALPSPKTNSANDWRFRIERTEFEHGTFLYNRLNQDKQARLRTSAIHGNIGAVGTNAELIKAVTEGQAQGILEKSAPFGMRVLAVIFSERPIIDLELKIHELHLEELNPFFTIYDGITLSGRIYNARASADVRGNHLTSQVRAKYKDLNIVYGKTKDRGVFTAFFTNLVRSFKLNEANLKRHPATDTVTLKRAKDDTLIEFILKGLRDAAMKFVTD